MKKSIFLFSIAAFAVMIYTGCATKVLTPEEKAVIAKTNAQLPFQIKIDENSARPNTTIAALIEEPVSATSEIICNIVNNDLINITFMPCDKDGIVVPGKKPALILLRDSNKTTLDQTVDKKQLKPGYYLMDVTAGDQTSRIVIEIK